MEEVYNIAKNDLKELYNINALNQMAFNNTYALAVTKELADKYSLESISDLTMVANHLTLGASLEFLNREDGIIGLEKMYNFEFNKEVGLNGANKYLAITNNETDVVDAFSTDGLLRKYELVVLEDDKQFFPPYYAVPLVREETFQLYPEVIPLLEKLGSLLDDDTMINLNYQVDEEKKDPAIVAREFLVEKGLLE